MAFTNSREDIPPQVWVRRPETPGMTDRVDYAALLTESYDRIVDMLVVSALLIFGMVSSGLGQRAPSCPPMCRGKAPTARDAVEILTLAAIE